MRISDDNNAKSDGKDEPGVSEVTLSQLQPGDILFYTRKGTIGLNKGDSEVTHVSIVTQANDEGVTFIHQTNSGTYGTSEVRQVARVPNEGDQRKTVEEGQEVRVMRCGKEGLGVRAAHWATEWSKVAVPYDGNREQLAKQHEKKFKDGKGDGAKALIKEQRALFSRDGKYRAIKYAARRNGPPCYPQKADLDADQRGMSCMMFVTTCYQVAGLEKLVDAKSEPVGDKRSADDKALELRLAEKGLKGPQIRKYLKYKRQLRNAGAHYGVVYNQAEREETSELKCIPSLECWMGTSTQLGTSFIGGLCTEGMMVDSKSIHCTGLYLSLKADAEWKPMRLITKTQRPDKLKDSDAYKAHLKDQKAASKDARQTWMANNKAFVKKP